MIRGVPKFDGIAIGEGTFSFLGTTVHLEAKAAFVDAKSGDTHGWTKNMQWSPGTMAKLHELRALMEQDLSRLHMQHDGVPPVAIAVNSVATTTASNGLAEFLDPPSV